MSLYRRIELADGHVKYDPVDDEIERLLAVLSDLRERSVEEGIHHFVKRIDAALSSQQHPVDTEGTK